MANLPPTTLEDEELASPNLVENVRAIILAKLSKAASVSAPIPHKTDRQPGYL